MGGMGNMWAAAMRRILGIVALVILFVALIALPLLSQEIRPRLKWLVLPALTMHYLVGQTPGFDSKNGITEHFAEQPPTN